MVSRLILVSLQICACLCLAVLRPRKVHALCFLTTRQDVIGCSTLGACVLQCGSLPIALARRGHRVMVVSPEYRDFEAQQSDVRVLMP